MAPKSNATAAKRKDKTKTPMVQPDTDAASRTTHQFDCPVPTCSWAGSIAKVSPNTVVDDTGQQAADDLLVCVVSIAEHLREAHDARMPGERAVSPPVAGGGGATA